MTTEKWVNLLSAYGGHGMPPGDDVGTQIILWSFLNIMATKVRHPKHGEWVVEWPKWIKGIPIDGKLIALTQGNKRKTATDFVIGDHNARRNNPAEPYDEQWEVVFS